MKDIFFLVTIRPVFGWWTPFTEFQVHTHSTYHTL